MDGVWSCEVDKFVWNQTSILTGHLVAEIFWTNLSCLDQFIWCARGSSISNAIYICRKTTWKQCGSWMTPRSWKVLSAMTALLEMGVEASEAYSPYFDLLCKFILTCLFARNDINGRDSQKQVIFQSYWRARCQRLNTIRSAFEDAWKSTIASWYVHKSFLIYYSKSIWVFPQQA